MVYGPETGKTQPVVCCGMGESHEQVSRHPWVCLNPGNQWISLSMYRPHVGKAEKIRGLPLRKTSGKS